MTEDELYSHHPDDLAIDMSMFPLRFWIPCEPSSMPNLHEPVVVKGKNLGGNTDFSYDIATWDGTNWWVECGTEIQYDNQIITHWMSLE